MIHEYLKSIRLYVKNSGNLIEVKGGDSGGKSVSRCDPVGARNEG